MDVGITNGDEVDSVLVQMARSMKAPILTTDYNLNRVAEFQGVQVLNVNELANAINPLSFPGRKYGLISCKRARSWARAWPTWTTGRWWW